MVLGIILNIWGCITTCDDRLVIYKVAEQKTTQIYYIVSELSIEINSYYSYKENNLPFVIKEVITLCESYKCNLSHDINTGRRILYGPHISRKQGGQMICEVNKEYMETLIDFKENDEDQKIRQFYKWLTSLLHIQR
jgi:hypothetical protein